MQVSSPSRSQWSLPARAGASWTRADADWTPVGRLRDRVLREVSGIVASPTRPDTFWVHNDSGDGPRLYAIDAAGALRQAVTVLGANAVDWEDIAVGPSRNGAGTALYVADTGDNRFARPVVQLYRVPEAAPGATTVQAERIDVRYPDGGARNVEAMLVDPATGDVVLVTKTRGAAELFRASREMVDAGGGVLEAVGHVDLAGELATGADVSRDGTRIVVRTYERVHAWTRGAGESIPQALGRGSDHVVAAPQSEAICFGPGSGSWFVVDEGIGAVVYESGNPWAVLEGGHPAA